MIFYVTFADELSGIYRSQVIDAVKFIGDQLDRKVELIAFVSLRNYFASRREIKKVVSAACVIPMFPKLVYWRFNIPVLCFLCAIRRPKIIIGRGVLACKLALAAKRWKLVNLIVYDGRGAISAEWSEYTVTKNAFLNRNIRSWEKQVVLESDRQLAVSTKLLEYWIREFNYRKSSYQVIPCTIDRSFESLDISEQTVSDARKSFRFDQEQIVLAFSGSVGGWQSLATLHNFLTKALHVDKKITILFLAPENEYIKTLIEAYPGRVFRRFVKHEDVNTCLLACDYGLLIRDSSITNEVASPVKFAEYLSCGLSIIISERLGDLSDFVQRNDCGIIAREGELSLRRIGLSERIRNRNLALDNFRKENYVLQYNKLVECQA